MNHMEQAPHAEVSDRPTVTIVCYDVTIESPMDTAYENEFEVRVSTYASGQVWAKAYWRSDDEVDDRLYESLAAAVRALRVRRWVEDEQGRYDISVLPPEDSPLWDDNGDGETVETYEERERAARPYSGPRPFPEEAR